MGTGSLSFARRTPAHTPARSPKGFGAGRCSCHQRHSKPGSERVAGEADLSQTGSGGQRVTLGVLALISHCQAAPSPGVPGHGPAGPRGAEDSSERQWGGEAEPHVRVPVSVSPCPCPRRRPPAVPGHPSAARGAHRDGGRGDRAGGGLWRRGPPKGVALLKPPTPLPPTLPTAGCGGAGGTHMSQERQGTRRGAKSGLARCIPFVPLPWTGASGEFVQALGSAHPGSLHGNAGAM